MIVRENFNFRVVNLKKEMEEAFVKVREQLVMGCGYLDYGV